MEKKTRNTNENEEMWLTRKIIDDFQGLPLLLLFCRRYECVKIHITTDMNWQGLNFEEEAEQSRKNTAKTPCRHTHHIRAAWAQGRLQQHRTASAAPPNVYARLEPCAPVVKTTGIATTLSRNCTVWTMTPVVAHNGRVSDLAE